MTQRRVTPSANPPYFCWRSSRNKKGGLCGRLFLVAATGSAIAADHGAHRIVGSEILRAVDIEQRREFRARAVDATLDGAHRAAADGGGVFVREAGGAD